MNRANAWRRAEETKMSPEHAVAEAGDAPNTYSEGLLLKVPLQVTSHFEQQGFKFPSAPRCKVLQAASVNNQDAD